MHAPWHRIFPLPQQQRLLGIFVCRPTRPKVPRPSLRESTILYLYIYIGRETHTNIIYIYVCADYETTVYLHTWSIFYSMPVAIVYTITCITHACRDLSLSSVWGALQRAQWSQTLNGKILKEVLNMKRWNHFFFIGAGPHNTQAEVRTGWLRWQNVEDVARQRPCGNVSFQLEFL